MIQEFLSHGISIPIGSSNKFTKKLVKMLHQNCNHCGLVNAIWLTIWHWLKCNGNVITGPYWNDQFTTVVADWSIWLYRRNIFPIFLVNLWLKKSWITNPKLLTRVLTIQNSAFGVVLDCSISHQNVSDFVIQEFLSHGIISVVTYAQPEIKILNWLWSRVAKVLFFFFF